MLINRDVYECNKCKKSYFFDTDKPYSKICPECGEELTFELNYDYDTEKEPPSVYDPTEDPNSPYYIPKVECPYCHSTKTEKIGVIKRSFSFGLLGFGSSKVGKNYHCKVCGSDF